MSASFLAIALLAAVLLVNWRIVLIGLMACLVALVVIGIGLVDLPTSNAVGQPTHAPTAPALTAPAVVQPPR